MNSTVAQKNAPPQDFAEEYAAVLQEHVAGRSEATLRHAYELGRRALSEQKSLVELALCHHLALQKCCDGESDVERRQEMLRASAGFFGECLSSYEMAHRGFQDAVKALRQLNETLEEEIKRIAYAVHDEAGQVLVAVHLALADLARDLDKSHQEKITRIEELLGEVESQLRRYSHELRPTILDDLGWIPAIRFLAEGASKRASLPIHVETTVTTRLPSPMETALYRVVQEALKNVVKHANAKNVWIRAWQSKQKLCCSVRDDGVGFDATNESGRKGLGLIAMQERVSSIGGTLRIESQPGRGTELSLQLPWEDGHANTRRTRR